jgi:hypothetical protein
LLGTDIGVILTVGKLGEMELAEFLLPLDAILFSQSGQEIERR